MKMIQDYSINIKGISSLWFPDDYKILAVRLEEGMFKLSVLHSIGQADSLSTTVTFVVVESFETMTDDVDHLKHLASIKDEVNRKVYHVFSNEGFYESHNKQDNDGGYNRG